MDQLNQFFADSWLIFPVLIWSLFWKGCALWMTVKNEHKGWFVAVLVLNTVGILELVYIFFVAKKKWSDVKALFSKSAPVTTE